MIDEFNNYKTPKEFAQNYNVDAATITDFKNYAAKDSITFNVTNPKEKIGLENQIKILTARQIWRTEGLYEVSNQTDPTVQKALQVLSGDNSTH